MNDKERVTAELAVAEAQLQMLENTYLLQKDNLNSRISDLTAQLATFPEDV